MKVVSKLSEIGFDKNSVVTVGTFDGVHVGHREIISEAVGRAKALEGRSVIITFEPHPREVVGSQSIQLLTTIDERKRLLGNLKPDVLFVVTFTYEFSRQSFRDFYLKYLVNGIGVSEIVEGYDHHFGRDREGSIEALITLGKEFGFSVVAVKPVSLGGELVSSTRIRRFLQEGNVEQAGEFLGKLYSIDGKVVRGDGRGKQLGFPTANIALSSPKKLIPKNGVYFVAVHLGTQTRAGMANIGFRPTFGTNGGQTVEVHLLEFQQDLYGDEVEVRFLKRLRDEQKFSGPEGLIEQLRLDREASLKLQKEFSTTFS
ncbi:MAG: bifunctional riboflavin kinase/FAD synthetase [Ignavibacteriae bacterium]|nr:bifunctional riboflavin kinase/FAD synthetase [Ignavibacteriota bacterium]